MSGKKNQPAKRGPKEDSAEFDFRYCYRVGNGYNDVERAEMLLKGIVGRG